MQKYIDQIKSRLQHHSENLKTKLRPHLGDKYVEYAPSVVLTLVVILLVVILKKLLFPSSSHSSGRTGRGVGGKVATTASVDRDVDYDVIVCGGSIAGTTTSIQLAKQGRKVLVVEKDLGRPDTIIGELMQPGGLEVLKKMELLPCAEEVSVPAFGYCCCKEGEWIDLPFPNEAEGCSFHHGDFVMQLRKAMLTANELSEVKKSGGRLTVVEGVVENFVFDHADTNLVRGIQYREKPVVVAVSEKKSKEKQTTANNKKDNKKKTTTASRARSSSASASPKNKKKNQNQNEESDSDNDDEKENENNNNSNNKKEIQRTVLAKLVICCDGGFSVLRPPCGHTPHSHFVGIVLRHIKLHQEERGNVILGKKGIVLSYRLDPNEVRFLIDWGKPGNLPPRQELIRWLREDMKPDLPQHLQDPFEQELQRADKEPERVRARPHYHFTPIFPHFRGYIGIGDHCNMRHPLTGAGMTVAMRDSYHVTELLKNVDLDNRNLVQVRLHQFACNRPTYSSVMNVLSWALYGVFTGPMAIRNAVMEYFNEGGDSVAVPLKMLAGLEPRFGTLLYHYIRTMFCGAKFLIAGSKGHRSLLNVILFVINPLAWLQAVYFLCYATYLFGYVSFVEFVTLWRVLDRPKWQF